VLTRIANFYQQEKRALAADQSKLQDIFQRQATESASITSLHFTNTPIKAAYQQLQSDYDTAYGGFGDTPKFAHPNYLSLLLRSQQSQNSTTLVNLAISTLECMANAGIYDQLGGGFFRYSVDAKWEIPHFEKMLYDNGQLLSVYAEAYLMQHNPHFKTIIEQTADWAIHAMQDKHGGFYATVDADSEHKEGKHYVWDKTTLQQHLTTQEFNVIHRYYGFNLPANFEEHWHLHIVEPTSHIADDLAVNASIVQQWLASAQQKMLHLRQQRIPPGIDKKILTGWNALMIKGLSQASIALNREDYLLAALNAVCFIEKYLWDGQYLYANFNQEQRGYKGYLDDYAFLLDGLLTLLQVQWSNKLLQFAITLANTLIQHFNDQETGGLFFTSDNHETLIHRPKSFADEAIPAGNAIAAICLQRLGHLVGNATYLTTAERILQAAWPTLLTAPGAHASLLVALQEWLLPPSVVIIRGQGKNLRIWQQACQAEYSPQQQVFAIHSQTENLPPALANKQALKDTVAYICQGTKCLAPQHTLKDCLKQLGI